jgi:hypothetical protein
VHFNNTAQNQPERMITALSSAQDRRIELTLAGIGT